MPGYLCHSRRFRKVLHITVDGKPRYELVPEDGETDDVSYSSWEALKSHGEILGIPRSVWPEFSEYEEAIDLPPESVEAKQLALREAIGRLDEQAIGSHYLLSRIAGYLRLGEQVFFC